MNYREKLVARLMLAVALMLARDDDHELRNELRAIRRAVEQGGELELRVDTTPIRVVQE